MAEWQGLPLGLKANWARRDRPPDPRRRWSRLCLLCVAYLPLRVWDFFRPDLVFPVPRDAGARIMVQLGLIWLELWVWRRGRNALVQ